MSVSCFFFKQREFLIVGAGWWPNLAQMVDVQLREVGLIPRYAIMINRNLSANQIEKKLHRLKRNSCRGEFGFSHMFGVY